MFILIGIIIILYSLIVFKKEKRVFPYKLKSYKSYKQIAKTIMILGVFVLFIGIYINYRSIDIFAIIMTIIIIILLFIKIIYQIRN